MRRSPIALAALAACALLPVAARAQAPAEVVLAKVDRATPIAAFGGRLAWSARVPGTETYRLVSRGPDGVVADVPVAPRAIAFDVDLGPAADGSVVAVYSRCATEVPAYVKGRGCDIYRFDFATGRETKVDEVSSPFASETWPTFWRPRLAFARTYDHKRDYPYLYVNALGDAQGSARMPGGQRNACARQGKVLTCSSKLLSRPRELELYGRRLAFQWQYLGLAEGLASEIRLDDVRSRTGNPRRLDRFGGGGLTQLELGWPAFEAGLAYWTRSCFGDLSGCPGRRDLVRSPYLGTLAPATFDPRTVILAHERDAGVTYVLRDTVGEGTGNECRGDPEVPGGTCEIVRLTPPYSG